MSKSKTKGQRRVVVTPEEIEAWLIHGRAIDTNLPNDARLLDHWVSNAGWNYEFLFESAEWEPQMEGEIIPQIEVRVQEDAER